MLSIHKKYFLFLFLFVLQNFYLLAQSPAPAHQEDADNIINQNVEILAEDLQSEDADFTNLTDQLKYFASNPINLNQTNKEELISLGLLSEIQIISLLSHINKNGKLITKYELQSVNGFDLRTIRKISYFIKVDDNFANGNFTLLDALKGGSHEIVSRIQRIIETQSGYKTRPPDSLINFDTPDSFYLGSPNRMFVRYRYTYRNNISIGFIAENDAGEAFRSIPSINKKAGFDFYTAHLFIKNIKNIKALALGDYQASFGQGLVLWRGFGFGKNAMITGMKRNAKGLNQYNSVDENRFMRGAAFTYQLLKKIDFTAFFSQKKIDGNLIQNVDTASNILLDPEEISSLLTGGYHYNASQQKDRFKVTEQIFGGNINFKTNRFSIGTTFIDYSLSKFLNKSPSIYNQFDFTGNHNVNAGADFSYIYKNVNFFGEAAISKSNGKALTTGLMASLDPKFNFVALYRNFDRNYQNQLALAISENTLPQNENGLYLGFEAILPKSFKLVSYIDRFQFPWLKSTASAASEGFDFFSQLNWTPTKKIDAYLRFRSRNKGMNTSNLGMFDYVIPYNQQNFRFNISFLLLPSLKLRTRIETVKIKKEFSKEENGFVLLQDVVWKKMGWPVTVTARYALFETDSYNSRVYTYENDVLYSFSVPALYGKGQRAYLMVNYDITRKFEIFVRVAQTFYTDKIIQNANDRLTEIQAPTKTEIKIQLRYKL